MEDLTQHDVQTKKNNEQVEIIFRTYFPDFPKFTIPFESVFKILMYLQETSVNPEILPRVIRGIHNIHLGTGQGDIIIHVRKDVTTMEVREREEKEISTKNLNS